MKIRVTLFTLILVTTTHIFAQQKSGFDLINSIKLDPNYIYGEATLADSDEAQELAQDFLKSNLEQWIIEHKNLEELTEISIDEIDQKCQRLVLPRGTMYKSFIYINLDNIRIEKSDESIQDQISADSIIVETPQLAITEFKCVDSESKTEDQTNIQELTPIDIFENELSRISNAHSLIDFIEGNMYKENLEYGDVNQNSIKNIPLNEAYLVIYATIDSEIKAILRPKDNFRINVLTGQKDSTLNYDNCKAVWIMFK